MSRMSRIAYVLLALTLSLALGACSSPPETADPAAPSGAADPAAPADSSDSERALVEQKCSMCHTTQRVFDEDGDAAEWGEIIDRMEKNGLVISGDERTRIIQYLSTR